MEPIKISKLTTEPIIHFNDESVVLPVSLQEKIDVYWQSLIDQGRSYTRGEVFTVTQVEEKDGAFHILVKKSDYAHYLYCQNIDSDLDGYGINNIHTSCLVETTDHKMILGKMNVHTSRAGKFQLCGGGLDAGDLKNGRLDSRHNMVNEMQEELGIDVADENYVAKFDCVYLKHGSKHGKTAVIYRAQLTCAAAEFQADYDRFAQKVKDSGEEPEFSDVVAVSQDVDAIEMFVSAHSGDFEGHLASLLRNIYDSSREVVR